MTREEAERLVDRLLAAHDEMVAMMCIGEANGRFQEIKSQLIDALCPEQSEPVVLSNDIIEKLLKWKGTTYLGGGEEIDIAELRKLFRECQSSSRVVPEKPGDCRMTVDVEIMAHDDGSLYVMSFFQGDLGYYGEVNEIKATFTREEP